MTNIEHLVTYVAVEIDLVALFIVNVIFTVLIGDALGSLFEGLDRGVRPPITNPTCTIISLLT